MANREDALKLERQLCFPLYAASRQVIRMYKPYLDPLGLTYTQYIVLLVLWEENHMTVKALGEKLFLDSGTLTPLLKKLESSQIIKRERSPEDERSVIIHLTQEGESLKKECVEIPYKIGSCLKMPMEDIQQLHRLLYRLIEENNLSCETLSK